MAAAQSPKILLFDIETAPALVYTFSLFKPVIGLDQIVEHPRILCWSAKWLGAKSVQFQSEWDDTRLGMLQGMRDLLDEADIVVGYNSKGFDVPWLTGEFKKEGIELPSPYQELDLWQMNKQNMRLLSGKLDYLSWHLLEERKVTHGGFRLWVDCLNGDEKARRLMKKYAKQDTALLEPLFEQMRPFIKGVNLALWSDSEFACPSCGGSNLQRRGESRTVAGVFQRYQCQDCGSWSRDSKRVDTTRLRPVQ